MGLSQASWYCPHPRGRRVRDLAAHPWLAGENHSIDFRRQPAKARFAYLRLLVSERSKREATQQDCKTVHVLGNPAKSEREEGRGRQRKARIGWLVLLAESRLALAVLGGVYPINLSNAETPPRVLNCRQHIWPSTSKRSGNMQLSAMARLALQEDTSYC
jgi:hypothetical protein